MQPRAVYGCGLCNRLYRPLFVFENAQCLSFMDVVGTFPDGYLVAMGVPKFFV